MRLIVNGEEATFADVRTVAGLLKAVNPEASRVAVLVNDTVIKSERRESHVLNDGDRVEILTFAGGG
jgi:sulfur carrier protein